MTHRIDPAIVRANLVTSWNSTGMTSDVLSYSLDVVDALVREERERLLKILWDNDIIRRCGVTNKLIAFQTDGEHVVYVSELEQGAEQ